MGRMWQAVDSKGTHAFLISLMPLAYLLPWNSQADHLNGLQIYMVCNQGRVKRVLSKKNFAGESLPLICISVLFPLLIITTDATRVTVAILIQSQSCATHLLPSILDEIIGIIFEQLV